MAWAEQSCGVQPPSELSACSCVAARLSAVICVLSPHLRMCDPNAVDRERNSEADRAAAVICLSSASQLRIHRGVSSDASDVRARVRWVRDAWLENARNDISARSVGQRHMRLLARSRCGQRRRQRRAELYRASQLHAHPRACTCNVAIDMSQSSLVASRSFASLLALSLGRTPLRLPLTHSRSPNEHGWREQRQRQRRAEQHAENQATAHQAGACAH